MSEPTLHLFHIDDDEDDRFFLDRAVRAAGLPIVLTQAAGGDEALARLQTMERLPDMILLDIRMPGMSGFDFLIELSRMGTTRPAVVVYSNSNQERDMERARELGALAYCVKPAGLQQLMDLVIRLHDAWRRGEVPCEWPATSKAPELK